MSRRRKTNSQPVVSLDEEEGQGGRWEELPPEVVEMFFTYVNNNHLLSLRLVSKMWKNAATSVIQRRCYAIATNWASNIGPNPIIRRLTEPKSSQTFPTLTLLKKYGLSLAFYPRGTTPLPRGYNPFITNSLVLSISTSRDSARGAFQNVGEKKRISIYHLLRLHGDCLTSLQLFGVTTHPMEFYKLLQQVPNLKALTLQHLLFKEEKTEATLPLVFASPVPRLTHACLRVHSSTVLQWLLNLLGPQLINLDFLYYQGILPFNQTNYKTTTGTDSKPFQKLKHLMIMGPNPDFVLNTGMDFSWPLKRLLIDCTSEPLSIDDLIEFITRFATSLTHLRCNFGVNKRDTATDSKHPNPVTFPKLLKFEFFMGDLTSLENLENLELVKTHLLPRFTKLETLRIIRQNSMPDNSGLGNNKDRDFFDKQGLWNLCPTLKTIEVSQNNSLEMSCYNVFTRQLRDRRI